MTGARGDVTITKQVPLIDIGVEFGLACNIGKIAGPSDKVCNRAGRSVAVEHFQRQSPRREIAYDISQRRCGLRGQQANGSLVAIDRAADKVV